MKFRADPLDTEKHESIMYGGTLPQNGLWAYIIRSIAGFNHDKSQRERLWAREKRTDIDPYFKWLRKYCKEKILIMSNKILCITLLTMLCSCVRYPLGLTREQWEASSPEEQAKYQASQYKLDQQRVQEAARLRLQRQHEEQIRRETEAQRIRDLYAEARYGDVIRVNIQGGSLVYYRRTHSYYPVSFKIIRGEKKTISVTQRGQVAQTISFDVHFSEDGNTLFFDEDDHDQQVFINRDWEQGQTYLTSGSINDYNFGLAGATVYIKFTELAGAPQKLIIEHHR